MYPYVTVIMPVKNEQEFIHRSLGAVLAQDYPADRMEVLIVDGMSTDRTHEVISQLIAQPEPFQVQILENEGRIVPTDRKSVV